MNPFFAVIGRKIAGGGGGGGIPDLVDQDFEGTGTPSGWYGGGGADYDYSAVPLSGSQSCRTVAAGNTFAAFNGAFNVPELWFKLLFKAESLPTGGTNFLIFSFNDGANSIYAVRLIDDGTLFIAGSLQTGQTVSAMSAGTIYNIWGHYKSVGAASTWEVSFDTVGNPRPNSGNKHTTITDGIYNTNATGLGIGSVAGSGATSNTVWDNVQVASSDIF